MAISIKALEDQHEFLVRHGNKSCEQAPNEPFQTPLTAEGPLYLPPRDPKPAQTLQAHTIKDQHRGGHTLRRHLPPRHQTCDNIPRTLGPQLPSSPLIHQRKHDSRTRKYLTLRTRLPFSPEQ